MPARRTIAVFLTVSTGLAGGELAAGAEARETHVISSGTGVGNPAETAYRSSRRNARRRLTAPAALKASRVRDISPFIAKAGSDPRVRFAEPNTGVERAPTAVTASDAVDTTTRDAVKPVFECVYRDATGQPIAIFGYNNPNQMAVTLPSASVNRFSPVPEDRGQPRTFAAGRVVGAFRVPIGTATNLVWNLEGRTSTAGPTSKACTAPSVVLDQVAVVSFDATAGGPEFWSLRAIGVPSVLATSVADAVGSKVVVLAGTLSRGVISAEDRARLEAHVANGGVVIGEAVTDRDLFPLFGIETMMESSTRRHISWRAGETTIADLNRADEREVDLTDDTTASTIGTVGYTAAAGNEVLAAFEDGSGAIIRRRGATGGAAYLVGARLLDLVTRHHEGALVAPKQDYANVHDTSADGWLLWLRGVYRTHISGGVTISTAPDGKQAAVIPTLSLNFSEGVAPTKGYVVEALRAGATPTVFAWPHYETDWLDTDFFRQSGFAEVMRAISALGAEIGSHSVSHSPVFNRPSAVPLGSGTETFENYHPFVVSKTVTRNATVLGDLRVSKQLLQTFQPDVSSYRQGYLLTRRDLVNAETAVGYRQDSSTQQGYVGGAFPFMVPRLDDTGFSDIVTYPIVLEDERGEAFATRIDKGAGLIAANAENGAPSVILVHPNPNETKRTAWGNLLRALPVTSWRGTLASFGTFWNQRLQGQLTTSPSTVCTGGRHIELRSPRAEWPLQRQALDVADATLVELRVGAERRPVVAGKVALPSIAGGATLSGDLCPAPIPTISG